MSLRDGEFGYHDLERAALSFILEDEVWAAFLVWMLSEHISPQAHAWLASGPDLTEARKMWAEHSDDPMIRAMGAEL